MSTETQNELDVLCHRIGLALVTWQDVEDAHFRMFFKLLGAPDYSVASLVYHHTESFEGRHTMVGRLIEHSLKGKPRLRKLWSNEKGGLQKDVKEANRNRNKLAHYSHDFTVSCVEEMNDGSVTITFSDPRLQPSPYNMVSRLLGRTPDKEEHSLNAISVLGYTHNFAALARRLNDFCLELPDAVPNPNLQQKLGVPPKYLLRGKRARPPVKLGDIEDDPA
ncbi:MULTISPECIES: hypothetical protein [unclassified Bradyrhizobium]|uniref:hypothetical protein n=1 Tax=unclassified Bradyrhizobium TaxID=2631580 RepID=UPI0028EDBB4C|nr:MULTISPECIES: hypothetical protein [unclassified Bradyrhizobium]